MSSTSTVSSPLQTERRVHTRRRMEGLAYVDLGPDNGAIVIDVGEGGMGFHSVAPVSLDQTVLLKFKLAGATAFIESYAEVVWLDESGKCGGLRFAELRAELREQVGVWAGAVRAGEVSTTEANAAEVSAAEVSPEVPRGNEATENTADENPTSAEPELLRAPAEFAAEPVSDEVSTGISEDFADADGGDIVSQDANGGDALPAVETSEERLPATSSAPTLPDNSELLAPLPSNLAAKKPSGRPPQVAEAMQKAAESAAGNPPVRPAGNAAAKAHPAPGAASEGVSSRVHSGIMAAASSESSVRAARVAQPAGPGAAGGAMHGKQAPPSQAANPVSAPRRDRGIPVQPRSPATVRYGENATRAASDPRQSQAPARWKQEWEAPGEEATPNAETLASQALKIGIGAAAGAILVLAIIALVPSLRTRVLATTNAKSAVTTLGAGIPEFQVEVADINNRRWILKSGGDGGSPVADVPSRRNAQLAATPARKGDVKSGRSDESDDATDAPAQEIPQPRTAKPGELKLARPLKSAAAGSPVQTLPPSIFDGITPPIGSLADNLPATGPNAPGAVPPESEPSARLADLQAAVLLEHVSPVYPPAALREGVKGEVRVKATIGKDGVPTNLKVASGDPRLIPAALDAIRRWRYRPATLEGQPIETTTTVSVAFQMN